VLAARALHGQSAVFSSALGITNICMLFVESTINEPMTVVKCLTEDPPADEKCHEEGKNLADIPTSIPVIRTLNVSSCCCSIIIASVRGIQVPCRYP